MIDLKLTLRDVDAARLAFARTGAVVAFVDADLRYVWVENPHPDFQASAVVGKRDDELIPAPEAAALIELERGVLAECRSNSAVVHFNRSDGFSRYDVAAYPVIDDQDKCIGVLTVAMDLGFRARVTPDTAHAAS